MSASVAYELGIVIPTLGDARLLAPALARLEHQRDQLRRFEVVVVHGAAATQAVEAAIGRRPYQVRRVVSSITSASAQRNAGWRTVSARLVLFIDDDVLALPGLVSAHLATHAHHPEPEVGVLGLVRWARRPRPSAFMRWLEQGIQFDFRGLEPGADAAWWRFYTANASVKRELLERVGGFDESRFPFGYEDLDLGARMAEHGFRLVFEPQAVAEHLHPQSLEDWRRRVWRIAASERRFSEVHPGMPAYFHRLFSEAAAHRPARGRGAWLAPFVPPQVPWLGPRVWASFDMWNRQQLAELFLTAWEAAGNQSGGSGEAAAGGSPPVGSSSAGP
jgi:GT2 family glycosyltransferase